MTSPGFAAGACRPHVVSPLAAQTVTASYIYAAHYGYSDRVLHNDNQLRIFRLPIPIRSRSACNSGPA